MGGIQIQEHWSGWRPRVGHPVGWLWSAAWALEGESGLYLAIWRRVDSVNCQGQSLQGGVEAMKARWQAEVAHKQREDYLPLGRKSRHGLPNWKDGSAIEVARQKGAMVSNPIVQARLLEEQLKRADSQAGVESLWGQYQTVRARLEAKVEYGEGASQQTARLALEDLVMSMREALS